MSRSTDRRGITLPEILISTGILSLVLLGCYTLVVFAVRWNAKMTDTMITYQRAFKASTRVSYDLSTASRESFIYDVDGFAFASARPKDGPFKLDPAAQLMWQKYVIYYLDGGVLYRNEVPLTPPTATPGTTPDLPTLKTMMTGKGAVMAENLSDLEIEPGSGGVIKFKVTGDKTKEQNTISLQLRTTFRQ